MKQVKTEIEEKRVKMVHFHDGEAKDIGMSGSSDEEILFNNKMMTKLHND